MNLPETSAILEPVATLPVNATFSIPGCVLSGAPASGPVPVTTLNTPRGRPILLAIETNSSADRGVNSLGFNTQVHSPLN